MSSTNVVDVIKLRLAPQLTVLKDLRCLRGWACMVVHPRHVRLSEMAHPQSTIPHHPYRALEWPLLCMGHMRFRTSHLDHTNLCHLPPFRLYLCAPVSPHHRSSQWEWAWASRCRHLRTRTAGSILPTYPHARLRQYPQDARMALVRDNATAGTAAGEVS